MGVDNRFGGALARSRQRIATSRDDNVAAEQQIRPARRDANRRDFLRPSRETQVRHHRAAFLGESDHVENRTALPFQVRRHADQCADGDDARAANAGDDDAISAGQRRKLGLRQILETRFHRRPRDDATP